MSGGNLVNSPLKMYRIKKRMQNLNWLSYGSVTVVELVSIWVESGTNKDGVYIGSTCCTVLEELE